MKYLNKFNQLITEHSKNNPIPELTLDKLCVILLGAPGVGKSTFIKNQIFKYSTNFKIFSTDDVSYTFTKDHNKFKPGSSTLNFDRTNQFIKDNKNKEKCSFIFDTTGQSRMSLNLLIDLARFNGFRVVFIHLMGSLELSLKQNTERDRNVDKDYIKNSYMSQMDNIQYFSNIARKDYYIIYNIDKKYKYMKYIDGKMYRRKVDKYVPLF